MVTIQLNHDRKNHAAQTHTRRPSCGQPLRRLRRGAGLCPARDFPAWALPGSARQQSTAREGRRRTGLLVVCVWRSSTHAIRVARAGAKPRSGASRCTGRPGACGAGRGRRRTIAVRSRVGPGCAGLSVHANTLGTGLEFDAGVCPVWQRLRGNPGRKLGAGCVWRPAPGAGGGHRRIPVCGGWCCCHPIGRGVTDRRYLHHDSRPAGPPSELLRRRPDLIAAERRLAASNARIGAAISEYYPKLSLSGLVGSATSVSSGSLFSGGASQATGVLGLRWRLFDFARINAQIEQAKGQEAEMLAAYRLAALRATEDVENSLSAFSRRQEQVLVLKAGVDSLGRARAATFSAYQKGVVSMIEVLHADETLLRAADARVQAQTESARSAVAIFKALGGGWESGASPT